MILIEIGDNNLFKMSNFENYVEVKAKKNQIYLKGKVYYHEAIINQAIMKAFLNTIFIIPTTCKGNKKYYETH